jgi:hypothetical protein
MALKKRNIADIGRLAYSLTLRIKRHASQQPNELKDFYATSQMMEEYSKKKRKYSDLSASDKEKIDYYVANQLHMACKREISRKEMRTIWRQAKKIEYDHSLVKTIYGQFYEIKEE